MNSLLQRPSLHSSNCQLATAFDARVRPRAGELIIADGQDRAIRKLLRGAPVPALEVPPIAEPLQFISTALAGEQVEVLHLVAHGRAGGFYLGGQWIDANALRSAAPLLAQWNVGYIALWACEAGADGDLVSTLARLTGARVHAARGRLGSTASGRVWALRGQGEAVNAPFAAEVMQAWEHELASFTFSKVYQVTNTAGKESNSHTFNTTALNSGNSGAVSDGNSARLFSGNDLSVTLTIGASTIHGWISRPIKVGGQVVGFYLWTDTNFTTLALAQADGNADGDSNTADNTGYILVVPGKESYFTSGSIGSSSDRVDSALNSVMPVNSAPVAVADASDTSLAAGASGGPALEAGAGVTTVNATGNVLTNDTDSNSGDTKAVSMIGTSAASNSVTAGTTSANGTQVTGSYGTLTIGADGSYSYAVANSNTTVQALRTSSNTLSDVFTYTMKDSEGATSTTTLTVKITGSNDAPSANADYNSAKESLSGASTFTGFSATGNVLTNDTDVDSGDGKSIVGISQTASASVGAVTVSTGSSKLTFNGQSGFNSVSSGQTIYVKLSTDAAADNYRGLFYSSNGTTFTKVTVSSVTNTSGSNYDIVLSQTPTHYYSVTSGTGTYVSISNFNTFLTTNTKVLFESSTATTENDNGGKMATVNATTGTGYTDISTLTSITGAVVAGMTVTGTGVPDGTTVSSVTYTSGAISSIRLSSELTSTSGGTFTFSKSVSSGVSYTGAHGSVTISSTGNYTYTPTSNNANLAGGESAVEKFDYTMQDTAGQQSSSTLYITVYGASATDPVATNDTASATEAGTSSGSDPTGNLLTNDTASTTVAGARASTATSETSISSNTVVAGAYGNLTLSSNGNYTYAVANSNTTVDALRSTDTLTETFYYRITDTDSSTSDSVAKLTITITGANDAPVANTDAASATEDGSASTGNVLNNDTDVDTSDTRTVTSAVVGSSSSFAAGDAVTAGSTSSSGGKTLTGTYGTLTIGANGTYSYAVNNSNATVQALGSSSAPLTDTFSYQIKDASNASAYSTLTVSIYGANDAPVNTVSSTRAVAAGGSLTFTSTNTISVNDVDGNIDTVTVSVENGTLAVTLTGTGATITNGASGTSTLTLSGTQTQINAALATLQYSPISGYYGADYLTVYSNDTNKTYDNDVVTIQVLSVNDITVNEASPYAVFKVSGEAGVSVAVALVETAGSGYADIAETQTLQYWSGSSWTNYNGSSVAIPSGGVLLVRASITAERDTTNEADESFQLKVTYAGVDVSGTATIVDDGNGTLYPDSNPTNSSTPATSTTASSLDDDRALSVNSITVNEASDYAVFEVTGAASQLAQLSLTNGTAIKGATTPTDGSVDYSSTLQYWDGAAWQNYTASSYVSVPGSGTLYVRVGIVNDISNEGSQTFTLTATNTGGTGANGTGTIDDRGGGVIYTFTGGGTSGSPNGTTTTGLNDDRTVSVSSITVNEASPYAVFSVGGLAGNTVALTLVEGSGTGYANIAETQTLKYWDASTSTWTSYNGTSVTIPTGDVLLVRVDISQESDTTNEANETFQLKATFSGTDYTGTATIVDDGNGTIYTSADPVSASTPATSTTASDLDDDRSLSVNSITVNEGSTYGVFEVTGVAGQLAKLSLVDVTAAKGATTPTDGSVDYSSSLQYWDGSAWQNYTANSFVEIPASGPLYVRVGIVNDTTYEGDQTFKLRATNTGTTGYDGTGTIDDSGGGVIFTFTGGGTSGSPNGTSSSGLNNDLSVSITAHGPVNEASQYAMFTVTATPSETLTLALAGSGANAATVTGFTMEFSYDGSTWSTYSSSSKPVVPVGGVFYVRADISTEQDSVNEADETFTLTASTSTGAGASGSATSTIVDDGNGSIYSGAVTGGTPGTTTGTLDNDVSGLALGAISGNTSEAGTTATFTVKLSSQPTHNVTVTVSSGDATEGSVSPTTLTFTTSNWNTNQTVTVTGVDDPDVDGDITYQVGLSTSSSDTSYNGLTGSVAVTNADNDVAAPASGDLVLGAPSGNTTESGGKSTFTVKLSAQPTQDVTVTISSSDGTEGSVGPTTLTFTASNWNTPQTVTVTGVDDPLADGDIPYRVDLITSSSASGFNGKTGSVSLVNVDNEGPIVSSDEVNEASPWAVWTVSAAPGARLDLGLSGTSTGGGVDRGSGIEYSTDGGATWSSGSPTVPAGGSLLARVPVVEDSISDNGETIVLTATNARGQTGSGTVTINDQGSGTIYNDHGASDPGRTRTDDRPKVDVSSVTVSEASPYAVVSVSLSNPSTTPISFTPHLVSGTATVGTDTGGGLEYFSGGSWLPVSGPIVLPPGTLSVQLRVSIQTDTLTNEGAETFRIETGPITGGVRNPDGLGGVVTITDVAALRDPVITDVTETPSDPTPSDLLTADTTQVVQVRGEPGCEVRLFRLDVNGTPQAVPSPAFVKTETSGVYTLDFGDGVLNSGEYVVQLVRTGYTSGFSNSFTIDSTPGLYDITGRREVVRIDATTSYTNGAVGGMDQNRLPTYWNGTDWLDSDGQRIRFTVDSLATFDKDAVPGAIWTTATAASGSTLKLNSQTGAYVYTPVRDATVDKFVLFASDGGKGASLTLTLDARDTLDRDGIPAGVESTLATSAGTNGSLADLNNDGIIDAQQNAVTTMAWTTFGVFSASLASQPVATSAVVSVQAVLSKSGSVIDDSMQLFNVKVLDAASPVVGGSKPANAVWDPIQFGIEPLQSMGLRDADPSRDGTQVRILIDISRSGIKEGGFAGYMKYVSAEAVAAGVRDLDGRPITSPGWYDFTQRTAGADGARFIVKDGVITAIELNLTDNAFGDNDMTVGRLFDPGVPVSQPPVRPVYATDLASQDKLWQLTPPAGPAPEIAFYTTSSPAATLPLVAWRNTLTGDLFYAPEGVAPPYACYVQVTDAPSLGRVLPVGQGAFDVHLYLRASDGITQEMGQAQAQSQGLLQKGYVDLGALFASAPTGASAPQVAAAITVPQVDLIGTQTLWDL